MELRPVRLIVVSVVALLIAVLAFMQSVSSVLTRSNSALAVQIFPMNGLAIEQLATSEFTTGLSQESDIVPSAKRASVTAQRAFANDPLTPKAMAVVAFGEDDPSSQRTLLDAATDLNRRDLLLQGLVLQGRVARKDYEGTLETLDSILRVHPAQKANFFPVLMQALSDDSALPALTGILDKSAGKAEDWHEEFLMAASRNPAVIPNLAKLRMSREDVNPDVDRRLIEGLVAAGEVEQARRIYLSASKGPEDVPGQSTLDWTSEFPPFDWKLADEAGFRAQLAGSSTELEIFVRGGKGGAVAEKLVNAPRGAFAIRVGHSLGPPEQVKDVRLQLRCAGAEESFFDEPFRVRPNDYQVAGVPSGCGSMSIIVHARAWSGRASIRGNLNRLELVQN